jgi:dihydroorotate dehydrogenase electron transfer subunit
VTRPSKTPPSKRQLLRAPLARRDSIGQAYHVLSFDAGKEVSARPGQFAMVRGANWGQAPLLSRPMSLVQGGRRPTILIKVVGEGTRRMAQASPGDLFDLLLPLGNRWSACPDGLTPVFVAGGVGIAPLLFFAREISAAGKRPLVLYGGRSKHDLPLDDEIAKVADVRLLTEDGTRGTKGLVTALLEPTLAEIGNKAKVYTCGPNKMMAAVAEICATIDVACEASLESPMGCGYGVCLGCNVEKRAGGYLHACVDGPCVDARTVAWNR